MIAHAFSSLSIIRECGKTKTTDSVNFLGSGGGEGCRWSTEGMCTQCTICSTSSRARARFRARG
jgi:hypothetical protein